MRYIVKKKELSTSIILGECHFLRKNDSGFICFVKSTAFCKLRREDMMYIDKDKCISSTGVRK
jgi:hypothetical protein